MTGTQVFALIIIVTLLICFTVLIVTAMIVGTGKNDRQDRGFDRRMISWTSGPETHKTNESVYFNGHGDPNGVKN